MEQLALFGDDVPLFGAVRKRVAVAVQAAVRTPRVPREILHEAVWPALQVEFATGDVGIYDANVAAIKTLKQIEAEQRQPTDGERAVLNRYSGWGRLGSKLAQWMDGWRARRDELFSLVSTDERTEIEASVNNAFYTPNPLLHAIWKIVAGLGFKGGRVLDPSTGTGYFVGTMPTAIAQRSDVMAVEIDSISARITKALYGAFGVRVVHAGYETLPAGGNPYDLAITNVPFGNYQVTDMARVPYRNFSIHDYFFAKSLDLVRPGGLVVFITSAFTLDKESAAVRGYLASKARLLGAFRLPVEALKAAGCSVMTDVVVLQRLGPGVEPNGDAWIKTTECTYARTNSKYRWNQWYVEHPERVIGDIDLVQSAHGSIVGASLKGDLEAALVAQVAHFAELGVVYYARGNHQAKPAPASAQVEAQGVEIKALPGSYIARADGSLWIRNADATLEPVAAAGKTAERIRSLVAVKDVARELVAAQVNSVTPEPALVRLRAALNAAYDEHVRKFGFLSEQANQRALKGDPSQPFLLALERRNGATGRMEKTELFTRRTAGVTPPVDHCDTPSDALLVTLQETGRVDSLRMAALLGTTEDVAMAEVLDAGLAFIDPVSMELQAADLYLSGNVREKLRCAKEAGPEFAANVAALEKVIPPDLAPQDIAATLGSPWIPEDDYGAWIVERLQLNNCEVRRSATTGTWRIDGNRYYLQQTAGVVKFKTNRIDPLELMEQALNQQVPTIRDRVGYGKSATYVVNPAATLAARAQQEAMKVDFDQWLWSDAGRATRLGRLYNDAFNNIARWHPDGSHLTFPGFTQFVRPRPHQMNAVWRIIAGNRNTLLGHVVGAGKTLTMALAGMELKRLGKARKPMYVVPNNVLEQFTAEFLRAYPSANVLMAGKADFEGGKRKELLARIATGDWDAVILTHPMFERIALDPAYVKRYIDGVIDQITAEMEAEQEDGHRGSRTFKELQRQRKVWTDRLTRLAKATPKDDLLTFDELGVDYLFVDEAHRFKNLFRFSSMTRVAGLPNTNSNRAFDMLLKSRYLMDLRHTESGVVFATGTPVSNSMAEMWVMQHYLQPGTLEACGVAGFDAWAANFGTVVNAIELAPDGSSYRLNARFARFVNLPELTGMFSEVADIQTAEMLQLPVPAQDRETVVAKATPALKDYVAGLVQRAEDIHAGLVKPDKDNMLKVTTDGRLAALDMRLVDADAERDPEGKVALCAAKVYAIWANTQAERSTQLVFCDLSTPRADAFNVYTDVKVDLMRRGVPGAEIAFMQDYDSDKAKARLFADVSAGVVRVLLGSTERMGMGTNVQTRLVALHHLDAPWRPADVEQREGRIVRQGNLNARVQIYRYVTESSFDAYMWQALETKAKFIAQVMSGDRAMRTAEDVALAALSYAEVKALASGNPKVLEKAAIDAEVVKLSVLKTQFERGQWDNQRKLATLPGSIARDKARLVDLKADAADAAKALAAGTLVVDGKPLTDRKAIAAALQLARTRSTDGTYRSGGEVVAGVYGGFTVTLKSRLSMSGEVTLTVRGKTERWDKVPFTGAAILGHLEAVLAEFAGAAEVQQASIEAGEVQFASLLHAEGGVFPQAARLAELVARQTEINAELGIMEQDASGLDAEADAVEQAA